MFWDKAYTPSQNIESLIEKENATVEEFLDDEDILQECKTQKKNIVTFFTRPDTIKRLVELIITEPSEDLPLAQRFRHANMACEILTLGLPSLDEKLLSDSDTLHTLYSYLENEPPLNPLLSSFFSKTFSMLFTKKPEQDWFLYQKMCLQLLEYIKSQNNFLDLITKHFSTPVIPDLLMQMMKEVDGGALKRNLYEWLTEQKLVERLIAILANCDETEKHTNASEFLCDLILQGRSMRQTEQENDSFEPAFAGSNPLLQVIESEATLAALMNVILEPSASESAIISGILVVLTLIKPVVFVDEPITDRTKIIHNRERENHDQIIATVIIVVVPRLKEFNEILRNPPTKPEITTTAATLSPPFGITRLQICRLFTVLLETGNADVIKAICETDFFETLLTLFKRYCWNNFLHSEVEKCFQLIFFTYQSNNNNNNSTEGSITFNDGTFPNQSTSDTDLSTFIIGTVTASSSANGRSNCAENQNDTTEASTDNGPSALQTHVIVNCKIISKLIDCWMHNKEMESNERGRRLGYMGHLIKILKHITACISESDHIGALIESSFADAAELELWQSIINADESDFKKALAVQNKMLANCNAYEASDYSQHLPKEFLNENSASDFINDFTSNLSNNLDVDYGMLVNDPSLDKFGEKIMALGQQMQIYVCDYDNDLVQFTHRDKSGKSRQSVLEKFGVTNNPWDTSESFNDLTTATSNESCAPWATDFSSDNFADFDSHFSSFTNDMGESLSAAEDSCGPTDNMTTDTFCNSLSSAFSAFNTADEEFDNNANFEDAPFASAAAATTEQNKFDEENAKNNIAVATVRRRSASNDDDEEDDDDDDFEDDDGIWTKAVGTAESEPDDLLTQAPEATVISNGSTTTQPPNDNDQLDNSSINELAETTGDNHNHVNNKVNNEVLSTIAAAPAMEEKNITTVIEEKCGANSISSTAEIETGAADQQR